MAPCRSSSIIVVVVALGSAAFPQLSVAQEKITYQNATVQRCADICGRSSQKLSDDESEQLIVCTVKRHCDKDRALKTPNPIVKMPSDQFMSPIDRMRAIGSGRPDT